MIKQFYLIIIALLSLTSIGLCSEPTTGSMIKVAGIGFIVLAGSSYVLKKELPFFKGRKTGEANKTDKA